MDLALYYRTARCLKWSQLAWRMRHQLSRRMGLGYGRRAGVMAGAATPIAAMSIDPMPNVGPTNDAVGADLFDQLQHGRLSCSGLALPFDASRPNWRLGECEEHRLPVITLHYHRWAFELLSFANRAPDPTRTAAFRLAIHLLEDWLLHCGQRNAETAPLAWNSYAIATRMEWWSRILRLGALHVLRGRPLRARMVQSMAEQTDHLHNAIEWDLRANHLFRDAVGLAWSARSLKLQRAATWRRTAHRIAASQLVEQVMDDGVHFERSPAYHVAMMHDIAKVKTLLQDDGFDELARSVLAKMKTALDWMTHPDGATAQWNDGGRRSVAEAFPGPRQSPPMGGKWLGDAGWAAWRCGHWFVLFDCGAIGPDVQPGHGHADTLSVEASIQGQRLFVDPGNLHYDNTTDRHTERSTNAHNTVTCDGADSSEVWHVFRVGRRAQVRNTRVVVHSNGLDATAEHDGFVHLPDRPIHRRHVVVEQGGGLVVQDEVRSADQTGALPHFVRGGWLLEPGWEVQSRPDGWRLTHPETDPVDVIISAQGDVRLAVRDAFVSKDYYRQEATKRLEWTCEGFLPLQVVTRVASVTTTVTRHEGSQFKSRRIDAEHTAISGPKTATRSIVERINHR